MYIYYPATHKPERDRSKTYELDWLFEFNIINGLKKILPRYILKSSLYFLETIKMKGIIKDEKICSFDKIRRDNAKYVPIIFSHDYGQAHIFYSTIIRDLTS